MQQQYQFNLGDRPITMAIFRAVHDYGVSDFENRGFSVRTTTYYTPPVAVGLGQQDQELGNMQISCVVVKNIDTQTHIPYLVYGFDRADIQNRINATFAGNASCVAIEVPQDVLNAGINREYTDLTGVSISGQYRNPMQMFAEVVRKNILAYMAEIETVARTYSQFSDYDLSGIVSNYINQTDTMLKAPHSSQFVFTSGVVIKHIMYTRYNGGGCQFELGVTPDVMRVVKDDAAF